MDLGVKEVIGDATGGGLLLSLLFPVNVSGKALKVDEIGGEVSGSLGQLFQLSFRGGDTVRVAESSIKEGDQVFHICKRIDGLHELLLVRGEAVSITNNLEAELGDEGTECRAGSIELRRIKNFIRSWGRNSRGRYWSNWYGDVRKGLHRSDVFRGRSSLVMKEFVQFPGFYQICGEIVDLVLKFRDGGGRVLSEVKLLLEGIALIPEGLKVVASCLTFVEISQFM
ncbi:uncharacterized protein H6S33_006958 [Morchella sextelata]|uniref:uncharacterized protein n=1 Tax=Morchella sextelata TaxID=1174677 RepID=UPI001D03E968|nr:uncharacterized protein H6S33_006958 [Morchella sextelata]KAH0604581.1 hypothetical protein H6S33_006958 [Morchella sextelata]